MASNHQKIITEEMKRNGFQVRSRHRRSKARNRVKLVDDPKNNKTTLQTAEKHPKA